MQQGLGASAAADRARGASHLSQSSLSQPIGASPLRACDFCDGKGWYYDNTPGSGEYERECPVCSGTGESDAPARTATITKGMFTSNADDWTTPDPFFAMLDIEFRFTLDPCCYPHTAKCAAFFTKEDDGLTQDWHGSVFVNPPYGRVIGKWVRKAYEAAQSTADVVVVLIPARTCSKYWHDYCMKAAEIRFVKGRLRFGCVGSDKTDNAPFPNAVIVFRKGDHVPAVSSINRHGGDLDLFGDGAALPRKAA